MAATALKKTVPKKAAAKAAPSGSRKDAKPSKAAKKVSAAQKTGDKILPKPRTAAKPAAKPGAAAKKKAVPAAAKKPAAKKTILSKTTAAKTAVKKPAAPKAMPARTAVKKTAGTKKALPKPAAQKKAAAETTLQKTESSQDRLRSIKKSLLLKKEHILKEVKEEISKYVSGENKQLVDTALDDGDWAVVDISEDINLMRLSAHRKLMYNIDEAIRKISEGTYGICEDCGEEISEKRLLVLPTATLCIDCQEQKEQFEAFETETEE